MLGTTPDLLRLVVIPVFGWAAYRDVKTRRVANRTWYPLVALAVVLLLWDGHYAYTTGDRLFFLQVAISVGFVIPLATAFWYVGSFGGADAKAFYVVALLFPVYPVYYLPGVALPMHPTTVGVFSLTILTNTVVAGAAYPLGVALSNLLRGDVGLPMVIARPVDWDDVPEEYGMLLETPEGYTRRGVDLDALRMYLTWRGSSLADIRSDPDRYRDPESLPAEPNSPGDGAIVANGGEVAAGGDAPNVGKQDETTVTRTDADRADGESTDDPWGAAAFLDDVEGSAYGTTPEGLREGLEVLASEDEVWISPGIPFLVPMFVGILVSLVYGDLLFALIAALGLG